MNTQPDLLAALGFSPTPCSADHKEGEGCLAGRSLAMVYAPCQSFDALYSPEEGLCFGTIFAELNKPFWGKRGVK